MFFDVYANWITSDDDNREMDKIAVSLNEINPELTQKRKRMVAGTWNSREIGVKKPLISRA
ncbi:hypothetical protein BCF11_0867 [Collimonas sp. PA-H2]|nr:hypothetical protein BCF11_0867 [Collimonas sp. PA-H2]